MGVKHLVVLQGVEDCQRLGQPMFLNEAGLLAKLDAIRGEARRGQARSRQASNLAALALAHGCQDVALALLRLACFRADEKRTLWAKYRRIQETLAQNAALAIVRRAEVLDCDTIAIEALGGLRSQDKGPRINWKVNAQIRAFTHKRVEDLAAERGLRTKLVSSHKTSLSCPVCRAEGIRTASPAHTRGVPGGAWFCCPSCGYNASADYVAATNVALLGAHARKRQRIADMPPTRHTLRQQRRALIYRLRRLLTWQAKHRTQPVSYTGAGPVLPFPLGRAARKPAARHGGYPCRIRLSQQQSIARPLAA